jgi:hypothetical protein
VRRQGEGKRFFFEKKKQKPFSLPSGTMPAGEAKSQMFFGSLSRKRTALFDL